VIAAGKKNIMNRIQDAKVKTPKENISKQFSKCTKFEMRKCH